MLRIATNGFHPQVRAGDNNIKRLFPLSEVWVTIHFSPCMWHFREIFFLNTLTISVIVIIKLWILLYRGTRSTLFVLLDGFEPVGLQTNLSCMEFIINQSFFRLGTIQTLSSMPFVRQLYNCQLCALTRKAREFYRFTRATLNVFIIIRCGWFESWTLTT